MPNCIFMNPIVLDKEYIKEDFTTNRLALADYENCTFTDCKFSDAFLNGINFLECNFIECDFANAKVNDTSFKEANFTKCRMLGVPFMTCNPFLLSFEFTNCNLQLASFYKLSIKKTNFIGCNLEQVDFAECNLTESNFENSNLNNAIFDGTNIEKSDFRTAYNYTIDPENNSLRKAKFSTEGVSGLLGKYKIQIT